MDVDSEHERLLLVLTPTMWVSTSCRVRRAFASLVSPPSILTNTCRPLRRRSPRQVRPCKTNTVQGLINAVYRGWPFYVGRNPVNGRERCLIESGTFPCGKKGRNGKEDTHGNDEAKKATFANPGQAPRFLSSQPTIVPMCVFA